MAEFKDMLKFFRERAGLSQYELAKRLGVGTSTISMYEVGKREPDFEMEEKIADFFNTDLNTLRGRDVEAEQGYYLNPETARVAQRIFEDKDLRALFDAAEDARPEDLEMAAEMLRRFKATNPEG